MATARHRLGVVVMIESPAAAEIDGLRRALGDGSLERIAPHITLVPPLNVRDEHLTGVLGELRLAAQQLDGPLRLRLGPPSTFLPANPVLFLAVGGDVEELGQLRRAVTAGRMTRPLTWEWVPHVTLLDGGQPGAISTAAEVLSGYEREVEVDRIVLLEERRSAAGRRWEPVADAALGRATIVGGGGLSLELTRGRLIDPETESVLHVVPADTGGSPPARQPPIVLTGRRQGEVAGVARAFLSDDGGCVEVLVRPDLRRQGIGSHLLKHLEAAVTNAGWSCAVLHARGSPCFYHARSGWVRPRPE